MQVEVAKFLFRGTAVGSQGEISIEVAILFLGIHIIRNPLFQFIFDLVLPCNGLCIALRVDH